MDGLRWLLLFFGLLVIAGVYLYTRREKARSQSGEEPSAKRVEPKLKDEPPQAIEADVDVVDEDDSADEGEEVESEAEPKPQKIVTLRQTSRIS